MKLKNLLILSFLITLLSISSCNQSQFSTTVRKTKNGKVSYTNKHHNDRIKLSKTKSSHNNSNILLVEKKSAGKSNSWDNSEITEIEPLQTNNVDLLASTSNEATIYLVNNNLSSTKSSSTNNISFIKKNNRTTIPDTIQGNKPKSGYSDNSQQHDTRRTEKLGLTGFILTLIGWVLVYGIPLCLLGVIFGGISLGKIHRNPKRYKGKGFAITSLILGIVGLVVGVIALSVL